MSGILLSSIFDFEFEKKLSRLRKEAEDLLKNPKDAEVGETAEVELGPDILWRKSESETDSSATDCCEEGSDDCDSDSDGDYDSDATITNNDEMEEGGYYEVSDYSNGEEGVLEWEMSTIEEETEDEEEENDVKGAAESRGIWSLDVGLGESGDNKGDGGMGMRPTIDLPMNSLAEKVPARSHPRSPESDRKGEDEHEQRGTGISTENSEGESGTPNDHSSHSASTDDDTSHDSPSLSQPSTDDPRAETCVTLTITPDTRLSDQGHEDTAFHPHTQTTSSKDEDTETGMHTTSQQRLLLINNNGPESRLRSVLRKPGNSKGRKGRCVTFNESLNLFYDAECSCWVHEDDYARYRQEELYSYDPLPLPVEFDEPPTLSPPEGYKDRFFPQEVNHDPDVTRVSPPSPPTARRKVFLRENPTVNGQEEEDVEEESGKKKGLRLGGILKGGRLWRSNSSDGKKVISPPEEPDVVKCTESSSIQTTIQKYSTSSATSYDYDPSHQPTKVSIGTAPLRTSEQIRLAVDSTLRLRKNKKPECSTLVEKLRWLTSLDDEDSDSNQSGFATWPSRDKNGLPLPTNPQTKKSDAGTSTNEEHFVQSSMIRMASVHEAKIKQISYTLEDIEEGLKGTELELETFISKDSGRIERIRKRYGEEGGDDYGFSRRPSVKGIKPKFSSTNQIFAQFTNRKSLESPALGITSNHNHSALPRESEYENTRLPAPPPPVGNSAPALPLSDSHLQSDPNRTSAALSYEFQNAPGRQTEESRAHFEMIRQSFEAATAGGGPNFLTNYNRPHSWSVSTLPHPHHSHNLSHNSILPINHHIAMHQPQSQQPLYGTVRRVPNVIGRPLFLHYGALSVEAHPNKIPCPPQAANQVKVPETPSPTQQTPVVPMAMRYYGPPIRYYNQPPPVPPRTVTMAPSNLGQGQAMGVVVSAPVPIGINNLNMPPSNPNNHTHPHVNVMSMNDVERGAPEGATDEEHVTHKEYSMNV